MIARIVLAGAIVAALGVLGCGGGGGSLKDATGVVVTVDAPSLTLLNGFTLHTDDGRTLTFKIAPGADQQNPQNGFVPGHLRTHALAATKVKILYRENHGTLLATRIEDILS